MKINDLCGGFQKLDGGFQSATFGDYEIRTAFQPIYTLEPDLNRLYGFEALARPLKNGRPIPPLEFFGNLEPATAFEADWVCLAVHLVNAAAWDLPSARLFVNLNPTVCHLMIQSEELFEEFASLAMRLGVAPEMIVCEISEGRVGPDASLTLLGRKLRARGFSIAIDGFCPPSSDLLRVIELEPSIVKIDSDWFTQVIADPSVHELAKKMMHRLKDIGADILIQGVETADQYRKAREYPASYIQGFLFGAASLQLDPPAKTHRVTPEDLSVAFTQTNQVA